MRRRSFLLAGAAIAALIAAGALTGSLYRRAVDLTRPYPTEAEFYLPTDSGGARDTVYVGVISRYPSSVIYEGYQPLMDYLSRATPYRFALRLSESYDETVEQLVEGRVAAAFLGSYLYVKANAEHGVLCVLQPVDEHGDPMSRAVLVVPEHSEIESLSDLAGRRLALPSELSFSANWLSEHEAERAGLALDELTAVRHFPHHHTVIYELLRGNFDAGVVKARVAREFLDRGIRIVAMSDPIPGAPIVVPAGHDRAVTDAMVSALVRVDPDDPAYAGLLATWDPEFAHGFGVARDEDYDGIRAMLRGARD